MFTLLGRILRTMAQNARLRGLGILILCVSLYPVMTTAQQPALTLMPLPANVQSGAGSLKVDSTFSMAFTGYNEPRLERAGERFLRQLARQTGLPLALKPSKSAKATLVIQTDHAGKEIHGVWRSRCSHQGCRIHPRQLPESLCRRDLSELRAWLSPTSKA